MKRFPILIGAALACCVPIAPATPPQWHFEYSGGVPNKLVWQTEVGRSYDLFQSVDLTGWTQVEGFPKPGTGAAIEHAFTPGTRGFFKISSEESSGPAGFASIPCGSFLMGRQPEEGWSWEDIEQPVHSVYVSGFYMAEHEVTKALWDEVRAWGLNNGYTDLQTGGGKAADHPVHSIDWYSVVKWCNARSQKEGLVPCYTVSGAVMKTGFGIPECNWSANGCRLPTEAEWEKAARGGLSGKRFPWGDTITHSQANYYSDSDDSYDVSPTKGYHPAYATDPIPYTSPVGSFAPNGYGLYDMSGNVYEWCWDWFWPDYYYSSPTTDPRGPSSIKTYRISRGGGYYDDANCCRASHRNLNTPQSSRANVGFRPARSLVP